MFSLLRYHNSSFGGGNHSRGSTSREDEKGEPLDEGDASQVLFRLLECVGHSVGALARSGRLSEELAGLGYQATVHGRNILFFALATRPRGSTSD